jgi:hypothetical protein
MKLLKFINEQSKGDLLIETLNSIKKDYSEIFEIYRKTNSFLYRGSDKYSKFGFKKPRTDRRPVTSSKQIHDLLDKLFYEKFKWKPRTEGLFVANTHYYASDFGQNVYLIFPKNGFKYIAEPINKQNIYGRIANDQFYTDKELKIIEPYLRNIIKNYKDNNINEVLNYKYGTGVEIAIKCSEYFYVDTGFFPNIIGLIKDF